MENGLLLGQQVLQLFFANDIRPDAKAAWVSYFSQFNEKANDIYKIESIVDLCRYI